VTRRRRPEIDGRTPVHVTLRMRPEIARLRRRDQYRAVRAALLRVVDRDGCRICQFSIQANHLHLIVEPESKGGLASGMIAFKTSCARRLNGLVGRRGRVFEDQYHARYLTNPAQVRAALCYVLNNWRRHGEDRTHTDWRTDPFSSAAYFDGWRDCWPREELEPRPVASARTWLLTTGWRRHGAIGIREVPGA
jgi:REP element-mobilizing transposase RayT